MKKILQFFKRIRCDHDYQWYAVNDSPFLNLRGEKRVNHCKKCNHTRASYFAEYEGNGFK